jgi:NitT/TauT family transport system substrate-binding protein
MRITLIENFRAVFYTPFYASFALNAYEAEGLEVQRVMSTQPAQTMQLLLSGQGDVAWGGPIRLMAANNDSPDFGLVIFCDVIKRDPFFLVGREPNDDFQLRDLMDKRLATVSEVPTPWLCLQHDLQLAGLDPNTIERVAEPSMPENVASLAAGEVDVIQVFQPYVEHALAANGHIWYAAADRGDTAYTALYTTHDFRARNPEHLLHMTRAMYRTQHWIATHEAAELAALVADFFPDVSRDHLTQALARYRALGLWNATTVMPQAGFDWLCDACLSSGFIERRADYDHCVDMQFARQVSQEPPVALSV